MSGRSEHGHHALRGFRSFCTVLLCVLLTSPGCDSRTPGTPANLRADYDRKVRELEEARASFEKQKAEADKLWRERANDKDEKVLRLTLENVNLRQRLLAVESSLQAAPLVDAAQQRQAVWVHVVYWLILCAMTALLAVLLWAHMTLRERTRLYVSRIARVIPNTEVLHGSAG